MRFLKYKTPIGLLMLLLASLGLTAQTGIFPAPSSGGTGTVSSVGLALPSSFCSVSGSPVTATGTLTCAFATGQTANLVFGTNASGNVGLMNLTAAQVPTLSTSKITGLATSATTDTTNATNITSGTLTATLFPSNQTIRQIGMTFDGGGVALSTSMTRCQHIDYSGTIQGATLKADQSGNATVDVKTVAYASYTGPSSATSIAASAIPAIASAVKYQDTTLTGWTKTLTANSEVCFALSSPSTVQWVQITLKVAAN